MKTKKLLGCFVALSMTLHVSAQNWLTTGNTVTGSAEWFGADAVSTAPLRIETRANQPIEWYTNTLRRMRLTQALTSQAVNGYTGLTLTGHLGVGGFNSLPGNPPPLTLLHLDNGGTEVAGYRPWMRTGTSMTEASEWMYVGFKREATDRLDAVINWADNRESLGGGQIGPDALRMVFTSPPTTTSVSGSVDGLEIARLIPAVSGNEGYFGIGDYYSAGLQPTERLDVLNGKVRIRQLPADAVSTSNEYVTVNTTTGVLEHRPLPPYATSGCEWIENAPSNTLTTATAAVGTNPGCPELDWKIGIGTSTPSWKLQVEHNSSAIPGFGGGLFMGLVGSGGATVAQGIRANVTQPATLTTEGQAIRGEYSDPGQHGYGVLGRVNVARSDVNAQRAWAVYGESNLTNGYVANATGARGIVQLGGGAAAGSAFGLHGETKLVSGASGTPITNSYGVWGSAAAGSALNYGVYGTATGNGAYAAYFTGAAYCTAGVWSPSDENLKSNVADFEASTATDILNSIQLHTYRYDREQFPQMNLPEGDQLGVLAQELEAVLPNSVRTAIEPEVRNEEGELEHEAVEFKAVNYGSLIPYLIGAYQEEHRSRVALEERMGRLEEQLAACCANPDGVRSLPQGSNEPAGLGKDLTGTDKLRIQPNPFNAHTTVYYTLDRGGRTQLLANSSDGRDLRVLQEASLEAGSYQFEWDTTSLAPGMYYVTLLLDGQPVVKKAVKVDR